MSRRFCRPALFLTAVFFVATLAAQKVPDSFDEWDPSDGGMKTGPDVGETIPLFRAPDQNGRMLDFEGIKGPKGALLLFFRSADW